MRVSPTWRRHVLVLALVLTLVQALAGGPAHAAPGIVVGGEAVVQSGTGLNIRRSPTTSADLLAIAHEGDFVHVLEGPRDSAGLQWYRVEYEGTVGWVAGEFLGPPYDRARLSARGDRGGVVQENRAWLPVPYKSQFDGSAYQYANCGPTSVSMALAAFGKLVPTTEIRRRANIMQGTTGWYDSGTAIQVLAELVADYGLVPRGLYAGRGFDRWTFDEVRQAVRNGHVLIPQVHLASLPGQERSNRWFDHYIVITGYEGKFFRYNDPAFNGGGGHGLLISEEHLKLAWQRSDYPFAAFSVGPGQGMTPLIAPPPRPEPEPAAGPPPVVEPAPGTRPAVEALEPAPMIVAPAELLGRLPRPRPVAPMTDIVPVPDRAVPLLEPEPAAVPYRLADASAALEAASAAAYDAAVTEGVYTIARTADSRAVWSSVLLALALAGLGSRRHLARLPWAAWLGDQRPASGGRVNGRGWSWLPASLRGRTPHARITSLRPAYVAVRQRRRSVA